MGNLYLAYFSATQNTKKVAEKIGDAFGSEAKIIDLTALENRKKEFEFQADDIVVMGAPVYAGRIPELKQPLFTNLKGAGTPAVLAVTYGNRAYEDALLELRNIALKQGFIPVAGGAFVGQHTYSPLLAGGRPNQKDLDTAFELGLQAKKRLDMKTNRKEIYLQVPGNEPYRKGMGFVPIVPSADSRCSQCKICVKLCPVGAIKEKTPEKTDVTKCIRCFACIQACPEKSRAIRSSMFDKTVQKLVDGNKEKYPESEMFLGS